MSFTAPGARRITEPASRNAQAGVTTSRVNDDAVVVDATFTSVCATVLLAVFIMSAILALGSARPVQTYAIVGSAVFGIVFGAFLMGAFHLAITDSRRHKD